MPRQQINNTATAEAPALELGWDGPGHEVPGHGGIVLATLSIHEDDVLRAADSIRARRELGHDPIAPQERKERFQTPPLTRADLNLLIRTARRARDRAFGGDE